MPHPVPPEIRLRRTAASDVPALYAFELDPAANELAGTKPRDWPTFQARWREILADTDGGSAGVTPRVILADNLLVGTVNIAPHDGHDSIGYWIDRAHWGRGIASRAVAHMLHEFRRRPVIATAAGHNLPSLRVLERHGFVIESRAWTPESPRCVARETVRLILR